MKNLKVYYYNLKKLNDSLTNDYICSVLKNTKDKSYSIEETDDGVFNIYLPKEKILDLIPKIGKKEDFSIEDLSILPISENEIIYDEIFCVLDTNQTKFYKDSLGILGIVKPGKAEISFIRTLFNKLLPNKPFSIEALIYRNPKKFLKEVKKITGFSFSILSGNLQGLLGENEDIEGALRLKDAFGGEEITITVNSKKKGLSKDKINRFFSFNKNNLCKSPIIDIDDAGEKLTTQIDNIRIIGNIEIDNSNKNIEKNEVFSKIIIDFENQINKIKNDLTIQKGKN